MHSIEPHYNWRKYYIAEEDERSPVFGASYDEFYYTNHIYGYYIHPQWDCIGSETLYVKLLYVDYGMQVAVIEMIGEWNDCLHNDVMHFKRNFIDHLLSQNITRFLLLGENLLNYHGSEDDDYYAEWYEEVEDGWLVAMNFREHVKEEWKLFGLDYYLNFGGSLEIEEWRTLHPKTLCQLVNEIVARRLTT